MISRMNVHVLFIPCISRCRFAQGLFLKIILWGIGMLAGRIWGLQWGGLIRLEAAPPSSFLLTTALSRFLRSICFIMGDYTTHLSDVFPVSPVETFYDQFSFVSESTPITAPNTARDLDHLSIVTRRPSNAPPSSPTLSSERRSIVLLPHPADYTSSRCCPLIYLDEQLEKVQPQAYQGEMLDFGSKQARRRFCYDDGLHQNEEWSCIRYTSCHCSSHDDDSTMVDPSSRAHSICSEAGTVLEDTTSKDRTVSYFSTHKAWLGCGYPELYPSDPGSLRHTMPCPSRNSVAKPPQKPRMDARRSYGLIGSPPVASRSRQISLPIKPLPIESSTTNPQMPCSVSARAQSWHASPLYSPSRKPPQPPSEMEKSIFEDYDVEDNVEGKKLSNRFRHLMRRLHCG